jgi:hypothetical protein
MGGTGMNTAIHARHNLGWKLAWVARGRAGDGLLDTYPAERRPIGVDNVLRSSGGATPAPEASSTTSGSPTAAPSPRRRPSCPSCASAAGRPTGPGSPTTAGSPCSRATRWHGVTADIPLNVVVDPSVSTGGAALVRPDGHVAAIVAHPTGLPAALIALLDRAPTTWRATA